MNLSRFLPPRSQGAIVGSGASPCTRYLHSFSHLDRRSGTNVLHVSVSISGSVSDLQFLVSSSQLECAFSSHDVPPPDMTSRLFRHSIFSFFFSFGDLSFGCLHIWYSEETSTIARIDRFSLLIRLYLSGDTCIRSDEATSRGSQRGFG